LSSPRLARSREARKLWALLLACSALARPARARAESENGASDGGSANDAGPSPRASIVIEEESKTEAPPPFPAGAEKRAIGEYIQSNSDGVHDCYARRVRDNPTLQGKLYARFQIGPSGRVIGAVADGIADQQLVACVVEEVRKWEFEKPRSGGKLSVVYPFHFTPIASQ
jgi:outer membrane biosynthesis protein TonB